MNDKTFFHIGIFFLVVGASAFLMVTKPWQDFQKNSPEIIESKPSHKDEVVVLNLPEKNTSSEKTNIPDQNTPNAPEISVNFLTQAEQFFAQGNFTGAIEMAQKNLETHPNDIQSLSIIADSYTALSDYFQAEQAISQIVTLQNTPQNQVKYIEILLLSGKTDLANTKIQLLPQSEEKVFYQMIIAVVTEDYDAIKKYAKTLTASDSQYKKTAQEFLNIFENYKTFRDGSPHYLRTMLANMLNILDYHTLTIEFIKPTLEEYPDYRDAWILMGNSYLSLKKFNLAERMLEKAISLDPSHPKTPYFLAITLAELGQYDDAIEQFNNALKNQYKPASKVQRYIAETYLRQKNYDKAVEYFQEVISDTENAEFQDYVYAITIALQKLK